MIVVRNLQSTHQINNPEIRQLVQERINDLGGEAFDTTALGYFLVIEPRDTLDAIDTQLGFSILANRFTGIAYDQPGFTPSFEFMEQFPSCYDMVFIVSGPLTTPLSRRCEFSNACVHQLRRGHMYASEVRGDETAGFGA